MMPTLKIQSKDNGERIDVVLARAYPDYSRSFLQKVLKNGGVTMQGKPQPPAYRVKAGDVLEVNDSFRQGSQVPDEPVEPARPKRRAGHGKQGIQVIYEDKALLVINKPAGLVVHPAASYTGATLIDWVRGHLGGAVAKIFTDPERLGLVHRLDKDTSGVLMIAKTVPAQIALSRQFHDRRVKKVYSAFVEGVPEAKKGVITAPIGRSAKQPHRMAISSSGRPSETAFEVEATYKEVSQVTLYPKTGRTHQIRVHLAAIGHPIVGDQSYGAKTSWAERFGIKRTLLHAFRLELHHPTTGKKVSYEAPWPADFKEAQKRFRAFAKTAALFLVGIFLVASVGQAEDAAPVPVRKTKKVSTASSGGPGSATASALKALRHDVALMQADVDGMRKQLDAIQTELEETGAAKRLHDLERSVSEINAKAVATSATAEEGKTQVLEASRKLKAQQDLLDQLRDQVDRLQRELIQRRTQMESAPASSSASSGVSR